MTFEQLYEEKALKNVTVPMRDGINLSSFILLPESSDRVPAVLLRTPYIKEKICGEKVYHDFILKAYGSGYAVVIQDVRGTGHSEGTLLSNGGNEGRDGYDTVEWLAAQEWCSGKIGMFGLSYFGFTQMAAAAEQPPHLCAICPFQNASLYPFSISQANTFNSFHLMWLYGRVLEQMALDGKDTPEKSRIRQEIESFSQNWNQVSRFLPARENPAAKISGVPLLKDYMDLVDGVEDDRYWKQAGRPVRLEKIQVPVFHLTGWNDAAKDGTMQNYAFLQKYGDPSLLQNSRLIIGPWTHGGTLPSVVDGDDYGDENSGENQHIADRMIQWFDRWLRDDFHALDEWKPIRYFELGTNRWKEADEWPPTGAADKAWYLHGNGQEGSGSLSCEKPLRESPDRFDYNPDDPLPSSFTDAMKRSLHADPQAQSERPDVLTYLSDPMENPLTLCGSVRLALYAATDRTDTDFFARLSDVDPKGRAVPLLSGIVRGRFRHGRTPEPLVPGTCTLFTVEMGDIAAGILPGHRLLLQISSSAFPANDRNLNTGERTGWGTAMLIAHQTVFHDQDHPTALILPVIKS